MAAAPQRCKRSRLSTLCWLLLVFFACTGEGTFPASLMQLNLSLADQALGCALREQLEKAGPGLVLGMGADQLGSCDGSWFDTDEELRIWSASKIISSALVHKLSEARIIDMNAKVNTYVQWWSRVLDDPRADVTMIHLLSHTAGFGGHKCVLEEWEDMALEDCARLVHDETYGRLTKDVFADNEPIQEHRVDPSAVQPGQYFVYAEYNFLLAAAVAEAAAGQDWNELFRHYLADPLGFSPAIRYGVFKASRNPRPGHGVSMSGEEFGVFLRAYAGGSLLSAESMVSMEAPHTLLQGAVVAEAEGSGAVSAWAVRPVQYGLGWWVECDRADCAGRRLVHAAGFTGFLPWVRRGEDGQAQWGVVVNDVMGERGLGVSKAVFNAAGAQVDAAAAAGEVGSFDCLCGGRDDGDAGEGLVSSMMALGRGTLLLGSCAVLCMCVPLAASALILCRRPGTRAEDAGEEEAMLGGAMGGEASVDLVVKQATGSGGRREGRGRAKLRASSEDAVPNAVGGTLGAGAAGAPEQASEAEGRAEQAAGGVAFAAKGREIGAGRAGAPLARSEREEAELEGTGGGPHAEERSGSGTGASGID